MSTKVILKKGKRKKRFKIDLSEKELEQESNQKEKSNRFTFKVDNDDLPGINKKPGSNEKGNKTTVRKRCAVCLDQIESDEGVFICNYCGTVMHRRCMSFGSSKIKVCPNCKKKIDEI